MLATVEWAKRHVSKGSTLFLASELEAKLDVGPWRDVSSEIYQSQLYPWIESGYRRYQHLAVMDFIICTAPQVELFLGARDSLLSEEVCRAQPKTGVTCRWKDNEADLEHYDTS